MRAIILLVDDEASVRESMRASLEECGHAVLTASTYDEALRTFREHSAEINLIITDISLPGNNGYELAAQVRKLAPAINVIFTSGQAGREICKFYDMAENDPQLLKKPFGTEELRRRVQSTMGDGCSKKCQAKGV